MGINKEELKRLIDERGVESLADLNSLLKDISREVIQSIYEGEIKDHLGYAPHVQHAAQESGNSRNGYGTKTVHTTYGDIGTLPHLLLPVFCAFRGSKFLRRRLTQRHRDHGGGRRQVDRGSFRWLDPPYPPYFQKTKNMDKADGCRE